ncbi:MAG: hypothetical protein ACRCXZ_04615 [Patescibacteria group bacterium]
MIIDTKLTKETSIVELKEKLSRLDKRLQLDIVLSTDDFASTKYVQMKQKLGDELGVTVFVHSKFEDIDLTKSDGIIIQLPCSKDQQKNLKLIPNHLDIDLFSNREELLPLGILPPTIKGIFQILGNPTDLRGKNVVIIGQGKLIGKPLLDTLLEYEATVTSCNEYTFDIQSITKKASIVVSGTGVGGLVDETWISQDKPQIWIDAGTTEKNGSIVGDIDKGVGDYSNIQLCPSPRGIGPLTVVNIFHNLVDMFVLRSIIIDK